MLYKFEWGAFEVEIKDVSHFNFVQSHSVYQIFVFGFVLGSTSRSTIFQSYWEGFLGITSTKQWG